jgi:penicillin-binding protein A
VHNPVEYQSAVHHTLSSERRHRLVARLVPLVALAVMSLVAGLAIGARHESPERTIAERFVEAWERGEVASMYELLDAGSRRQYTLEEVRALYEDAAAAASLRAVSTAGPLEQDGEEFTVPMTAETRVFGSVEGDLRFTVTTDSENVAGVTFAPRLVFPGLADGETLERTTELPPRADLHARDGQVLAEGPDRASESGLVPEIVGSVGPIPAEEAERYAALGYPDDATVGLSGLEAQFEARLAGKPGGTLSAGDRVLATTEPEPAEPVRTSIDVELEAAAATALAGRLGGIAVLRPETGEVLALAGYDCCLPQPPGSTFKIVTLAGALENGTVEPGDTYEVATSALLSGVELQNANGELCGGTLEEVFAHSCNSAFGPMGAELGAEKLVETAEKFGFNDPAAETMGGPPGSIPPAGEIGDDLAVGSSAIGQGQVTASPMSMAEVAAVIANDGVRVRPVFARGQQGRRTRAVSKRTAKVITRYMRAVVDYGTGTAAEIEGEDIAGKTGTAELRTTQPDPADPDAVVEASPADTDAWFVAFAPAQKPKVVVAVMLVGAGAGGETAAPAARIVLDAAL